ncbi:MAG TPA: hypothetical protein VEQ60_14520 [Longimicrobium sp.]|nr:hypothetical protein [Longimicrobium sp.]
MNRALRWVMFLVLIVVSAFLETIIPLSVWQKRLGFGAVVLALALIDLWIKLNDSDLAYIDRDSNRRMARLRARLRRLLGIPVI